jgi:hypothetical protein
VTRSGASSRLLFPACTPSSPGRTDVASGSGRLTTSALGRRTGGQPPVDIRPEPGWNADPSSAVYVGNMKRSLLPGDWVEVRPASEIVQTLDTDDALQGLPFMPEMLPFAGRRFKVVQRAERTCVHPPQVPFPKLADSVVLDGLRCDGSLHGGCDLGCMFFWKESWLRPVDSGVSGDSPPPTAPVPELPVKRPGEPERYVCQATELLKATTAGPPLWNPGQYLNFVRDRTYTVPELAVVLGWISSRKLRSWLRSRRPAGPPPAPEAAPLDLQPGEWVEVRSLEEILPTLDSERLHKGLAWSGNMVPDCGTKKRVLRRVDTLIEERTGRLRTVRGTVLLEGSICDRYLGCARGMPFLWREIWVRRIEPPVPSGPSR